MQSKWHLTGFLGFFLLCLLIGFIPISSQAAPIVGTAVLPTVCTPPIQLEFRAASRHKWL
jgi:hypothetical protein